MKLTVVGCSGSFPSADSPCSSYLVEAGGLKLVVDLGNGALGPLQKYCSLYEVDAVLLSHLHADHCIDLCSYYVARNYRLEGCPDQLPVYGPSGTADRLARAYDMPEDPGMKQVFDFRTLHAGSFELGPVRITAARVNHLDNEAYGFRIEHNDKSLVYSGDTGRCPELVELARGADLFLCEAAYTHGRETYEAIHLNGREAGEHAAAAGGVGRLVLTHIPPWTDGERNRRDAQQAYSGPVTIARAGAVYEL